MSAAARNRFYPHIALTLALFTIFAFSRTYYFRFLSDLPPLVTLVHLHGLLFTSWLVVFVVQTRFIARDRVDLHMRLGLGAVFLAAAIVAVGLATAFHSAAIPRIRPSGLTPPQFSVVAIGSILLFATFVALGVALRHRAALHKRFMVLAMIAVLGPPVWRLINLFSVQEYASILQPAVAAVFVGWCLFHDWRRNHLVHPVYVIGGLVLVAAMPVKLVIARSEWWQPIGEWVARVGAGV